MAGTVAFLEKALGIRIGEKQRKQLSDPENPHFGYDLLGVLKAELVDKIYEPAEDECISISELIEIGSEVNAIICYAYLGDVGESVTGDKKTAKFEDDYLDELLDVLKEWRGGITYASRMRHLPGQKLCRERRFVEISGEDINSPRRLSRAAAKLQFSHLIDATWKLIEHERSPK